MPFLSILCPDYFRSLANENPIFWVKNKLLDQENPQFAVLGIKIGQEMAEKELLVKKRDSEPVCTVAPLQLRSTVDEGGY